MSGILDSNQGGLTPFDEVYSAFHLKKLMGMYLNVSLSCKKNMNNVLIFFLDLPTILRNICHEVSDFPTAASSQDRDLICCSQPLAVLLKILISN